MLPTAMLITSHFWLWCQVSIINKALIKLTQGKLKAPSEDTVIWPAMQMFTFLITVWLHLKKCSKYASCMDRQRPACLYDRSLQTQEMDQHMHKKLAPFPTRGIAIVLGLPNSPGLYLQLWNTCFSYDYLN